MREEILESIQRMRKDDLEDVCITCGLDINTTKAQLKKLALADEDIAEYALQY